MKAEASGSLAILDIPSDFPRPTATYASVPNALLEIPIIEFEGKYYRPGCTPPELWQAWALCEELAQQIKRACIKTKGDKSAAVPEKLILQRYYEGTLLLGWGTDEEIAWVFRRVAGLLNWPLPERIPASTVH